MGSFNVACTVSGVSINCGDPIVYIPLELYRFHHKLKAKDNILIYPWCFYVPATLPIIGIYGDYGLVDRIERNKNIEVIENHFGMKVEDIIEKHPDPIDAGMYVHGDVYKFMITCNKDDLGGKDTDISKLGLTYDKFVDQITKSREREEMFNKKIGEDGEPSTLFESFSFVESWNLFNFREFQIFQKIYRPLIESKVLKKELIEFVQFTINMTHVNSFFFPACNGPQLGNPFACQKLAKVTKKILDKEIFDYYKYQINSYIFGVKWRFKEFLKKYKVIK